MPRTSQNALKAGTFTQPGLLTQKSLSTHSNVSLFGQDEELKEYEERGRRAKEEEDRRAKEEEDRKKSPFFLKPQDEEGHTNLESLL